MLLVLPKKIVLLGGGFGYFFIFIPIWGRFPFLGFKNNQLVLFPPLLVKSAPNFMLSTEIHRGRGRDRPGAELGYGTNL